MNMTSLLQLITLFFLLLSSTTAKEPELPLCPTSIPYFPQTLPMHCRMPGKPNSSNAITIPPGYFQNPPSDKQLPNPIPIGMPGFPGMPGMPPGMPMPGMPMPGAMPIPIGMPGPPPMPGQKLPVIVMPFYRPDNNDKNNDRRPRRPRRPRYDSSETESSSETETDSDRDTDTDSSDGSDSHGWWRPRHTRRSNVATRRRRHRKKKSKKHLLTPVLQYVTKDGYVIFEKKISKGEAKDWLTLSKNKEAATNDGESTRQSIENIQIDGHPRLMSDTDDEEDIKLEAKPEQVKAKSKKVMKKKARRVTLKNLGKMAARDSETKEKNAEAS